MSSLPKKNTGLVPDFLDSILNAIPDPVFVKDDNHIWVYMSDSMCEFFKLPREKLIGHSDYEYFPREQADVFREKDREVFDSQKTVENIEEFTDQAGVVHVINTRKSVFFDSQGKKYLVGTIRDITTQVVMQRQLEEARTIADRANNVKSQFLANMSHEIRTPMNAILGLTELVLEGDLSNEDNERYLKTVISSGKSLLTVLNDVLDLSKLDAKKLIIKREDLSLRELLLDITRLFAKQSKDLGVELVLNVDPECVDSVSGDESRLRQVLTNLISNAFKFTPKGGKIFLAVKQIRSSADNYNIQFSVADTGIGISSEKLDLIFEAFQQGDMTSTRATGGSGLGLTISKELVRLMGGNLKAESSLGVGSNFTFNILLYPAINIDSSAAISSDPNANKDLKDLKILIVEDNRANQMLVKGILEREGCLVSVVENGEQALPSAAINKFDLILMDLEMPVMDGLTATKAIREGGGVSAGSPVIFLTAHALDGVADKCLAVGAHGVITKPIASKQLKDSIRSCLKSRY